MNSVDIYKVTGTEHQTEPDYIEYFARPSDAARTLKDIKYPRKGMEVIEFDLSKQGVVELLNSEL